MLQTKIEGHGLKKVKQDKPPPSLQLIDECPIGVVSKLLNNPFMPTKNINYDKFTVEILKDVAKKRKIIEKYKTKQDLIQILKKNDTNREPTDLNVHQAKVNANNNNNIIILNDNHINSNNVIKIDKNKKQQQPIPQLIAVNQPKKQMKRKKMREETYKKYLELKNEGKLAKGKWKWKNKIDLPKFDDLTTNQQAQLVWMSIFIDPTQKDASNIVCRAKCWWNDVVTNSWLNDSVINCLQHLIYTKFNVDGCFRTIEMASKRNYDCRFHSEGIQVLHTGTDHWILAENIFKKTFNVWDGLNTYNNDIKFQLCKVK